MMSRLNGSSQQGFTLVTVLILSMMAGVVVLNSLKDSVVQERLSGNFQKKMNARLISEKGIFDTYNALENELAANPNLTISQLIEQVSENGQLPQNAHKLSNMSYKVALGSTPDDLTVSSDGTRFKGKAQLEAKFEIIAGTSASPSPFAKGITGCEGVLVQGSGVIDSYNSNLGDYDEALTASTRNKNDNVTVRTLKDSGEIKLTGGADIDGDVIATNSIVFNGSANVSGDVKSNGYLELPGNSAIGGNASAFKYYKQSSGSVGGNIHANGKVTISQTAASANIISRDEVSVTGGSVQGYILALSDVTLKNTTINNGVKTHTNYKQTGDITKGGVRAKGNATLAQWGSTIDSDDLRYGGQGSFTGETPTYYNAPYKVNPAPSIVAVPEVEFIPIDDGILDPNDPNDITCDPLNIENEVSVVDVYATDAKDLYISGSGSGDVYLLSQNKAEFTTNNGSGASASKNINAEVASFLNKSSYILMYDNVTIKGHLNIKSGENVTMYVKGNFKMSGASSLTIPNDSSLTLIIKGALDIGAGSQVYTPDKGLTSQGLPVFSIYSSYSGTGINLTGGTEEIYAAIYAPLTDIKIASAVGFKGSLLGKSVSVTGAGGVHYDEALGQANSGNNGGSATPPRLVFKGWQYL